MVLALFRARIYKEPHNADALRELAVFLLSSPTKQHSGSLNLKKQRREV